MLDAADGTATEEEAYSRARVLSQGETAEMQGISKRAFRCWRDRYEAKGAEGDRRLGRVSARRPVPGRERDRSFEWLRVAHPDAELRRYCAKGAGGWRNRATPTGRPIGS